MPVPVATSSSIFRRVLFFCGNYFYSQLLRIKHLLLVTRALHLVTQNSGPAVGVMVREPGSCDSDMCSTHVVGHTERMPAVAGLSTCVLSWFLAADSHVGGHGERFRGPAVFLAAGYLAAYLRRILAGI